MIAEDLDSINSLEFEATLPCEHVLHESGQCGHKGPAWALIHVQCGSCGAGDFDQTICEGAWTFAGSYPVKCPRCDWMGNRDEWWRILRLVNP